MVQQQRFMMGGKREQHRMMIGASNEKKLPFVYVYHLKSLYW